MKFGEFLAVVVILAGVGGYIANIVKLIGLFGAGFGTEVVLRCVGLFFAPLGAILGFF